jgi:hypothetical protein
MTPAPITIVLIISISSGSKWILPCDHPAIGRGHQDRLDSPALRQRTVFDPRLTYEYTPDSPSAKQAGRF